MEESASSSYTVGCKVGDEDSEPEGATSPTSQVAPEDEKPKAGLRYRQGAPVDDFSSYKGGKARVKMDGDGSVGHARPQSKYQRPTEQFSDYESDSSDRDDFLGLDLMTCCLLIYVTTVSVMFTVLYLAVYARDHKFFEPLEKEGFGLIFK